MAVFKQKALRYYTWLIRDFAVKHLKLIIVSFIFSILCIVTFLSLAPYVSDFFLNKTQVVGLVGKYDFNMIPEEIASKISNGLTAITDKGEIIPVLASTWEQSDEGKTYRFHLRKNLYWTDGTPFTAQSIPYAFKDVEKKAKSDSLLEFRLSKPLSIFPTYLTQPIIKYPLSGIGGLYRPGRFRMKYGYFTEIHLVPNKKGIPSIRYKFYDDEAKMIDAYKLGEITLMTVSKKSVADLFSSWNNTKIQKRIDYTRLLTLFFNLKNKELAERDIRQAIAMTIDKNALKDFGQIADSSIAPISWAYNPNLKQIPYNPEVAEKIIKKSIDATQSAQLNFTTYYDYIDIANQINSSFQKAGLKTNMSFASASQTADFDMLLAFFKIPYDPDQYFFWYSTQKQGNITGYNNKKVDQLLEYGRDTLSLDERKKIYFDFQKVINDEVPAVFLYYPYVYVISRK